MTEVNGSNGSAIRHAGESSLAIMKKQADETEEIIKYLRRKIISATKASDWIKVGTMPYLKTDASVFYSNIIHLSITNLYSPGPDLIKHTDGGPDEKMWTISGDVTIESLSTKSEMGTSSTRDKFYAWRTDPKTKNGYWLGLHELPLPKIKLKALTNLKGRAVKNQLNIHPTWAELEEITGIKESDIKETVEYMGGSKKGAIGPEAQEKLEQMKAWAREIFGGDGKAISEYLFQLTDNPDNNYKGKRRFEYLTEAQITKFLYFKFKDKYAEFKKDEIPAGEK